ncbi:DUF72 domain-containing protein [Actinokineospora sp. 24-640]
MIRVGTSGWVYPEWRRRFYPPGLPQRGELAYLSRRVGTIEINGSFYGMRKPTDYQRWRDTVPEDFVFAVKGPKVVTHDRRLRAAGPIMAEFLRSGVEELGDKLGPVLWQTPASLRYEPEVVAAFLSTLPPGIRHAVEVRHPTFADDRFTEQLAAHDVALVVSDSPSWPCFHADTAAFTYLRLHGDTELYKSRYSDASLDHWATYVTKAHSTAKDVYVYFDNTMCGHAPYDAESLTRHLLRAV